MKLIKCLIISLMLVIGVVNVYAQRGSGKDYVTVQISPDRADRCYAVGDDVKFNVAVMKEAYPMQNIEVSYEWGEDMLKPTVKGNLNTEKGYKSITLKGKKTPGFMTCAATVTVDGIKYTNYTTVGFDPLKIKTTTKLPDDFQSFWQGAVASAKRVPLAAIMTIMPQYCTAETDVYNVRFQNSAPNTYIYGVLSMPKKPGVYPAVLSVPGAGVRPYFGDLSFAAHNIINLQIGIHGIPVDLPLQVYNDLGNNALNGYNTYKLDDRDRYYYKKVYTGCVKALDFLCSLPQVDSQRLAVSGGSQGGALAIVTASLDNRIKFLCSNYPALSELGGYYYGKTGGWPHMFRNGSESNIEQKVKVSEYYDVVNFARFVTAPGIYSWGYNDKVCPPTSTYAAYNQIKAPKKLILALDCGHWLYGEQRDAEVAWLAEQLKK